MNKKSNSDKKKAEQTKKDSIDQELEKAEILRKADESIGQQLVLNNMGNLTTEDEIKKFFLGDIPDDPEKKYDVYYKGIEALLKQFLPSGQKYADLRRWIREEKNIFLTRGHKLDSSGKRGADSRMAYISDMEEVMNLITQWAVESRNLLDLYYKFRDKNIEMGYHKSLENSQLP